MDKFEEDFLFRKKLFYSTCISSAIRCGHWNKVSVIVPIILKTKNTKHWLISYLYICCLSLLSKCVILLMETSLFPRKDCRLEHMFSGHWNITLRTLQLAPCSVKRSVWYDYVNTSANACNKPCTSIWYWYMMYWLLWILKSIPCQKLLLIIYLLLVLRGGDLVKC